MKAALAAALLWPALAAAQDRPPALPTRDVDVTYQSGTGAKAVQQRSRFSAELQRARLDTPTPGFYLLVDYRAHAMQAVSDAARGVLDMDAPAQLPGAVPDATFIRRGEATVAGIACTEWETRDTAGQLTLACFTADGAMLRARRGGQVLATAVRVAYGPLDPALFAAPPGYERVTGQASP